MFFNQARDRKSYQITPAIARDMHTKLMIGDHVRGCVRPGSNRGFHVDADLDGRPAFDLDIILRDGVQSGTIGPDLEVDLDIWCQPQPRLLQRTRWADELQRQRQFQKRTRATTLRHSR